MPYREEVEEAPCFMCDARTPAGVGCLRCDLVLCAQHRPASADLRCDACEREWAIDSQKLAREVREWEERRELTFITHDKRGKNPERHQERWLHRHPLLALGAIAGLVTTAAVVHHALPLIPVMFLVEYPILGRWRNPRQKIDAARRTFLAQRHVRLLKSPGGSAG